MSFFDVKTYESKWNEVSREKLTKEELDFIKNPRVSEGKFGWNVKFNPNGDESKEAFIPISTNSDIELVDGAEIKDLAKRYHIVLKRGNDETDKIE